MKKLVFVILVFSLAVEAQSQVVAQGSQTRGVNSNAQLKAVPVTITSDHEIYKVEGAEAGFWIETASGSLVFSFFNPRDAVGKILHKGKYKVYPNLPSNGNKSEVKVYLRPVSKK